MVEDVGAKIAWTLPLLWNEWQHKNATKLLRSNRETRPQMDKQAQPEEKLQLGSILPFHPI